MVDALQMVLVLQSVGAQKMVLAHQLVGAQRMVLAHQSVGFRLLASLLVLAAADRLVPAIGLPEQHTSLRRRWDAEEL